MKKMNLTVLFARMAATAVLVLALVLPAAVFAEIREGSFELTGFGGYNFFETRQNLHDHPIYGGRLGYNVLDNLGVEFSAEFMNTAVYNNGITGYTKGRFTAPAGNVDIMFWNADLVYHFMPEGRLNPFLAVGAGATQYTPSIENYEMTTLNFAAGVKYWVLDDLGVRLDLRDNMVSEFIHDTYNNVNVTIGIDYQFLGKKSEQQEPTTTPTPTPTKIVKKEVVFVAEEPKPEEKVLEVVPKADVVVLVFEDMHFNFDKSTLTDQTKNVIKKSIKEMDKNPNVKILIAGYTSAAGTKEYNQKLSERRAAAVRDYLVSEKVISPDRLSIIGYGEMRPQEYETVPSDHYSKAAKANMTVLFTVVVK
jgi:OOP family OmpA-OmpF porin